ncbi:MAG: DUF4430 domain-containing protein [Coriobacteriia bacterium]|nr:DUF4430 domain-containing protein [Coriobacteriia bacterium]
MKSSAKKVILSVLGILLIVSMMSVLTGCLSPLPQVDDPVADANQGLAPTPDNGTSTLPTGIRVKVLVECVDAVDADVAEARAITDTGILYEGTVVIGPKDTVMDALRATVLLIGTPFGESSYVESIEGISQAINADYPMSGWVFYVNDEMVMEACDVATLKDGDEVVWHFMLTFDEQEFAA